MVQRIHRTVDLSFKHVCFYVNFTNFVTSNTMDVGPMPKLRELVQLFVSCWRLMKRGRLLFIFTQFYIVLFYLGTRPRISDATADEILERIARGHTSDMDLSDSDDDVADATFSAPALPDAPSSDEDDASDDEEPSTSCRTKRMPSWEAAQG